MPEGATYQHGAASFTCFMVEVECESHSTREFGTRCLLGLLEKYEGAGDSASFSDVFSFEDTQQESSCARAKFFLRGREQKCNIAFAYASRLPADEGPCGNFGRAQCQEVSGDKLAFCPMSHTQSYASRTPGECRASCSDRHRAVSGRTPQRRSLFL